MTPSYVTRIRFIPETLYLITVCQSHKVVHAEEQLWDESNAKTSLYMWTVRKTIAKRGKRGLYLLSKLFSTNGRYCHCKSWQVEPPNGSKGEVRPFAHTSTQTFSEQIFPFGIKKSFCLHWNRSAYKFHILGIFLLPIQNLFTGMCKVFSQN